MDQILAKHLASAFLFPKEEKKLDFIDESIIPYHSYKIIDNSYFIKTDVDTIVSECKGTWKDKPVILYKKEKYVLLENSQKIVKLNTLDNTGEIVFKTKPLIQVKKPKDKIVQIKKSEEKEVIEEPKQEKEEPKLISIPLNTKDSTASYISDIKKSDESAEENVNQEKDVDIISTLVKYKDDPRVKSFFNYHSELAKKEIFSITEKFSQQQMARAMESGGGTNAVQFANGGTMSGDLLIDGNITFTGDISGRGIGGSSIKKIFNVGNGIDSEYILLHSLGTKDILVSIYDQNDEIVYASVKNISINETKVSFSEPISTDSIKVVII
jgi:hypothetical protein